MPPAASHDAGSATATACRIELIRPRQAEKRPPCQADCPCGTDIRGWLGLIAQRGRLGLAPAAALAQAWRRLVAFNPFPAVTGRVCPHDCESRCNRAAKDDAVAIHLLEQHLGDWALAQGLALPRLNETGAGKSVGVIGAGPAGLSFAYQMARRGYAVTVYERKPKPGGMLRHGIPAYRLPRAVLDGEIARIAALGVAFEFGIAVGAAAAFGDLETRHAGLFVAIGASRARALHLPGADGPGVHAGIDFMARINAGLAVDVGSHVVVVGGGNTAIDAARAARRLGAAVTMIYRRSRAEMPAVAEEIDDALAEGVLIRFMTEPCAIERDAAGAIVAVELGRMELGAPDASGRRRAVAVPGATERLAASAVIVAVSQEPDWSGIEHLAARAANAPDSDALRFGGDVTGLGTVARAIGHGRRAAEAMHARLCGLPAAAPDGRRLLAPHQLRLGHYPAGTRIRAGARAVADRLAQPHVEIRLGIAADSFLQEAARCLSCGSCLGCQRCWMFCNADGYRRQPQPRPGDYFAFDAAVCEGCAKCIEVCPCGFLEPAGA